MTGVRIQFWVVDVSRSFRKGATEKNHTWTEYGKGLGFRDISDYGVRDGSETREEWSYKDHRVFVEGTPDRKTSRQLPLMDPFPIHSLGREESLPSILTHV